MAAGLNRGLGAEGERPDRRSTGRGGGVGEPRISDRVTPQCKVKGSDFFTEYPMIRFPLLAMVLLLAPMTPLQAAAPADPRINIIFILADDLGIGNIGCYGADNYRTPNIDALARGGVRFANAFTAPLCGPSRALILTGRYAFRTGATNQDATGRMQPGVETMMPAYLKQAGYATSCIGKWGQLPLGPTEFGFDDFFKFRGSGVYWNSSKKTEKYWVNGEEKSLADGQYMPDLMHEHLIQFITRNRDQPFYVYYSLSHVHSDLQRTPDSSSDSLDPLADNIAYMDKLVGRLVSELDRLMLRERTLLVFMGDNGTGSKWAERSTIAGRRLVGEKGAMTEGGGHVPLIVNGPVVSPAGRVIKDLVDGSDFVPTFAELARSPLPSNRIIDGRSFAPQLRGEQGQPRNWIFNQLANQWYVRDANWKLNQKGELFDMRDAPFREPLVALDATDREAVSARQRLQAALDLLNPAGGVQDDGDGTGRHAKPKDNES